MIIVRVELHSAITGKVTELARMLITNDGSGDAGLGHYNGKVVAGRSTTPKTKIDIWAARALRVARVCGYHRKRLHVWNLVSRMLTNMGYK